MESYYSQQASQSMPYFSGHYRQRGSGFGALAAGIGRVALPIARKFIWPAAKKLGQELLTQGAPELVNVVTKKQTARQALKNTVKKTARKQLGGSYQRRRRSMRKSQTRRTRRQERKNPSVESFLEKAGHAEVGLISSLTLKMRTNYLLPAEATHSSLDLFEKPPLLATFDQSFEQKTGPLFSPSGSFEVIGDRNNFIDLQKIYLEIKCRITKLNGADLDYDATDTTKSDDASFSNNALHSMFSDCTVSANGIKISSSNGLYAQKVFIETEFSHGKDAKDTWLNCQGYIYEANPGTISTSVQSKKREIVRQSAEVNLYGRLAVDFFHARNILLTGLTFEYPSEDRKTILLLSVKAIPSTITSKLMQQIYLYGK